MEDSLQKISGIYDQIRDHTLLEFDEIPIKSLEIIWHELGRIKEYNGNKKFDGYYNIISVCKPLMLLWGQTLAFDSRVRKNMSSEFNISKNKTRWIFENWMRTMKNLQTELNKNPAMIDKMKKESAKKFGINSIVPYGRYLDIYYF